MKQLFKPTIGCRAKDLPTPCLVLDVDIFEKNMLTMTEHVKKAGIRIRPHFKTHKCSVIAGMQMEMGAIGITCAKISEAAVLVEAGISDILIANQIVDLAKISALAHLAQYSRLTVAVDSAQNLKDISAAFQDTDRTIGVVIEIDTGMGRCGVNPGNKVCELGKLAVDLPGIRFEGVMGYEGHIVLEPDPEKRKFEAENNDRILSDAKKCFEDAGIPVNIVTGAGTGTYAFYDSDSAMTEIQAGSYVFMDSTYEKLEDLPFKQSLFVRTKVVSKRDPEIAIVDAGMKTVTHENGLPQPLEGGLIGLIDLSEEHGKISDPNNELSTGDTINLVPTHCCTTVNLHDYLYCVKDGLLVDIWEITGRGCVQ